MLTYLNNYKKLVFLISSINGVKLWHILILKLDRQHDSSGRHELQQIYILVPLS